MPTENLAQHGTSAASPHDSATWWQRVRDNPQALLDWLYDQYRGERGAGGRIERFAELYTSPASRAHRILSKIAAQERNHAAWIADLLRARGVIPEVRPARERYWGKTLPGIRDLASGAAVGAHAERMRLLRIEVIANDPVAPADVRAVFLRILPQERFHERAFRALAGADALAATASAHTLGAQALGLLL
jgi:hypothetical protein